MSIYFYLLDGTHFEVQLVPPLAESWRRRSFEPCRALCASLLPAAAAFREKYRTGPEEPLLAQIERGLPFDRNYWRLLVAEVLLFAAQEMPEIQTATETLSCLLAGESRAWESVPRAELSPIEQAHFGSRDLTFGSAFYRPEHAGYNDRADTARLAEYLGGIDPATWRPDDLAPLAAVAEEDRDEELAFARDWFGPLQQLYRQAAEQQQVIVCEVM